ncbi:MAG TPA: hypothetical protein VN700_14460 [Vicinamibacterales bacterium]|nr:hypothetical protein [Vicinamibacterales bacterium]
MSKAGVDWNGLFRSVESAVQGWQPTTLKTELAYSNALATHLRAVLPDGVRVEREYRHEGTTADLCVLSKGLFSDSQVLIEVKCNLQKKAAYDRLVGQVEGLRPKKNRVVVVLVGDTDPALLGRLKEQFGEYLGSGLLVSSTSLCIVLVPPTA